MTRDQSLFRRGLLVLWMLSSLLLLYAAFGKHPYSFYILLRWLCCPVFAYSAIALFKQGSVLVWLFGVLATLYNPIFRVHLDRGAWQTVNWITVGLIVAAAVWQWRGEKESSP